MNGPAMFEDRYHREADPWGTLTDPDELAKADHTLRACGPGPFARACELGAGIGNLTARLAPRCEHLLSIDGSPSAVAQAARRLERSPGVHALVGEIPDDLPRGAFDLVVASEILYYLAPGAFERTLVWIARHMRAGGRLVSVHWTGSAPDLVRSAEDVRRALVAVPELELVCGETRRSYRLDVLERR